MRHAPRTSPDAGATRRLHFARWCLAMACVTTFAPGAEATGDAAAPPGPGGAASPTGAAPASRDSLAAPANRDSLAAPARIAARVVADTLHLTVEVPARAMAAAGALLDRNADGTIDPTELAASRDTLASYLGHHLFILQDDGMLEPKLVGPLASVPGTNGGAPSVRGAMRAPLLNTYERIGFASGILTDRIHGYRSLVAIEWSGARAEFDVAQSVQWVEPPAAGATELELPGRMPAPGHGEDGRH